MSRKMTTINYVRNLGGGGAWSLMCYWVRCFEARPGPVPRRVPYPQFRMQFPDTCSSSLSEKPGILTITFQSMKCAQGNCMRMCADRAPPPPTGTAAWPSGPSGALHTGGAVSLTCACASARCPARPRHCPLISHVIPLRLVQSLNLHRWNCNVFGVSRKMTTINYVRNLGGGAAGSLMCALRVDSLSGQAPPPPTGTAARPRASKCSLSSVSHAIP